ncbi:M14 family zinc carboxypeptidase [Halobacillus sp. A5]|uniref:M14 family zinc carboxypeptidase n=1 Tax=Halobacillus sp. A5 TaxID=2880263 RepID=UPI0020A6D24B|nr:M14 family zinc carboxypeptidase [Halobacillus sp. A5]MCP3027852.1 carboxypeptidase [Halobacillus sp. A5]
MKNYKFKKGLTAALTLTLLASPAFSLVSAEGSGPEVNENQQVKIESLTSNEELADFLREADEKSEHVSVEVIGQSIKGRDLNLVKAGSDPNNPTILMLTQQHGNEALVTESAVQVIKKLSTNGKEVKEWLDNVNVLFVPRLNPDGAAGDVDWDTSHLQFGGMQTRNNAAGINLNRTHNSLSQPETRALHEDVLQKYDIDYAIDFHHQIANRVTEEGELVSGALLFPTSTVTDEVLEKSQKLGAVVYNEMESKGYGTFARYAEGDGLTSNARNHFATHYDIPTILFENRGMTDSPNTSSILGQKSSGYLIKQGTDAMLSSIAALADGSIEDADASVWDTMPDQYTADTDSEE